MKVLFFPGVGLYDTDQDLTLEERYIALRGWADATGKYLDIRFIAHDADIADLRKRIVALERAALEAPKGPALDNGGRVSNT